MAPGLAFAFGLTGESFLQKAMDNGWLLTADSVARPATTNQTTDLQLRATLEPLRDLKIDLNASRTESRSRSIEYVYKVMPSTQSGTFSMTTMSLSSSLEKIGDANNGYPSKAFDRFCDALPVFQQMAVAHYGGEIDQYSAAVMIPAFLDSYTSSGRGSLDLIPTLTKMPFAPLLGVDVTFLNNLTMKAEYRRTRVLTLSMTSVQINESRSNDWVIGFGYKISNFRLFGGTTSRKIKKAQKGGSSKNNQDDGKKQSITSTGKSGGVNHDLNLRLDISLRDQAAITRDIATRTSSASSGNSALKISFMADYTLSRLLTLSAYYDRQTNTPLLSSSSYPTTTHDFGISMKFSLTR